MSRVMDKKSRVQLSSEELLYLRGLRVLVNASAVELRRLFKVVWDRQNPQDPWQDDARSGKMLFDNHKPKRIIKRYEDRIQSGNTAEWDMTILCRTFIEYNFCVDTKYRDNVNKLRTLRNVYSHVNSMSRSQAEFDADLKIVTSVFQELGLKNDVLNDALHLNETDTQWEERKQLQQQLRMELGEEIQQLRCEVHDRFDGLEARLYGGGGGGGGGECMTGGSCIDRQEERRNISLENTPLPDWFSRLPTSCRHKKIGEQDLVKLIKHIGGNWELVAVELGVKKTEREKAITTHRSVDLQMMDVFMKWAHKVSKKATLEAFVKALYACNDVCTIDWDGLEEEFSDMFQH